MLSNGYTEGVKGKIPAIDCALFLAKIIYTDLVVANASAWHFWNSFEPGRADYDSRFYLLALQNNASNTEGDFTVTKNLWALGHFSRFIRPGMQRVLTSRSDGLTNTQAAKDIMLGAFASEGQIVVTIINYANQQKEISLALDGVEKVKSLSQYVTSAAEEDNMKKYPLESIKNILVRPRSIVTLVIEVDQRKI
jgi:O-glycosyl hydrolase